MGSGLCCENALDLRQVALLEDPGSSSQAIIALTGGVTSLGPLPQPRRDSAGVSKPLVRLSTSLENVIDSHRRLCWANAVESSRWLRWGNVIFPAGAVVVGVAVDSSRRLRINERNFSCR